MEERLTKALGEGVPCTWTLRSASWAPGVTREWHGVVGSPLSLMASRWGARLEAHLLTLPHRASANGTAQVTATLSSRHRYQQVSKARFWQLLPHHMAVMGEGLGEGE